MGRLVRKPQIADEQISDLERVLRSDLDGIATPNAEPGDDYLLRMVKYIPGEVLAFTMLVNAILQQALRAGGVHATMAGIPVNLVAVCTLIVSCLILDAAVLLVRAPGWRRLDRQRHRLDDRVSVLGLSDGRGRLRQLSGRQSGGDPGADLHRGQRRSFAAGAQAEAARRAGRHAEGRASAGRRAGRLTFHRTIIDGPRRRFALATFIVHVCRAWRRLRPFWSLIPDLAA